MITVINATNRPGNLSQVFSIAVKHSLLELGEQVNYYTLENLPSDFAFRELYGNRSAVFKQIIDNMIKPATKVVFVVPEYNGSYAGILKMFLEAIHPSVWNQKKGAVIGISSGRGGNLIGIDQLVTVLNYLQINVMPQRLPISRIEDLLVGNEIKDEETIKLIKQFVEKFVKF